MVNTVVILGIVHSDPEQRALASGETMVVIEVLLRQQPQEYVDVIAFGELARYIFTKFQAGDLIFIDGRLTSRTIASERHNHVAVLARRVLFKGRGNNSKSSLEVF